MLKERFLHEKGRFQRLSQRNLVDGTSKAEILMIWWYDCKTVSHGLTIIPLYRQSNQNNNKEIIIVLKNGTKCSKYILVTGFVN